MIEAYQRGATAEQVAKQFGLGKGSVVAILQNAGVSRSQRSPKAKEIDEAMRLYIEERWSLERIGGELGFRANTIRTHLLRRGVVMRS